MLSTQTKEENNYDCLFLVSVGVYVVHKSHN